MKLIIGTANAGSKYSLNQYKKNSQKNLTRIINYAKKNNILTYDTAPKYKNAEKILGNQKDKKIKIITKISETNKKNLKKNLIEEILNSRKRLNVDKLYGLLIHDINFFRNQNSKVISEILHDIKKRGIVKKIGFSVYSPNDVDYILKYIKPDIVQLPLSIFDRRFMISRKIKKLNTLGVEVHVRSIFMRGLLLSDINKIPDSLNKLKPELLKLKKWCVSKNISQLQIAVNFIRNNKYIDAVVVGVDSVVQLKKIILAFKSPLMMFPKNVNFKIQNKYLDIRKWEI
jgi:aryl-alcohol dehydrogenase-like predicted oxidoreductase